MNNSNEKITELWQQYINHKLNESKLSLEEPLKNFLQCASVDFIDYEEFDYLEYGSIAVRYFDLALDDNEIEIRRVDSLENKFQSQWGLMGKGNKHYFDTVLKREFGCNEEQTDVVTSWVDTFLRVILKK